MKTRKAAKELCEYGGNEYWEDYKKAIHSTRFLPFCRQVLTQLFCL